ncbi:hypothetical protein L861_05605 [Litchfieldella anticariensis FP35 = DSM 16096]|uniref:Uncharacterized protein n=1 Tax=Litchfieldella anticariensis (strain DSM 16096 / CECT 5854 / CIP 108499 / LMG 22089 / FP35) TaxID=1121939 RepID=S2L818_LITA3|nr:hypothetical protein L861_05605 [Halomonas anticariensis FP35 = DSM 16096]
MWLSWQHETVDIEAQDSASHAFRTVAHQRKVTRILPNDAMIRIVQWSSIPAMKKSSINMSVQGFIRDRSRALAPWREGQ